MLKRHNKSIIANMNSKKATKSKKIETGRNMHCKNKGFFDNPKATNEKSDSKAY